MIDGNPTAASLRDAGVLATLRDGSRIRVRQWHGGDQDLWLRGFEHLATESRYRRFLTPVPRLTQQRVRELTEFDHDDRDAVIALDEQTGEGIGIARFVRYPERSSVAELAMAVVDEWQGRGVGTKLLAALCVLAGDEGVTTFTALMLATNKEMMQLLRELGPVRLLDRDGATVEVEVTNPSGPV